MSTSAKRKRSRKRTNNTNKEKFSDKFKRFKPQYLHNLLWEGYYRESQTDINLKLALDIENMCRLYLPILTPKEEAHMKKLEQSISGHDQKILTLGHEFNALWSNKRKILCYRIIHGKNKIETLKVEKADDSSIYELKIFIEYILFSSKTIKKLDLSNMSLTDIHIVWLCNTIQNIIKHWNRNKKHSKRKIHMRLTEINLSSNKNISDKQVNLLLRTIRKYLPGMNTLRFADSGVTNKSISTIVKYRIKNMIVYLDGSKGITVETLKKYQQKNSSLYCVNLIHYHRSSGAAKARKGTKKEKLQKMYGQHDKAYKENNMRWEPSEWGSDVVNQYLLDLIV